MRKHGFKPHEAVRSDSGKNGDDPLEDTDTIPAHILNDEVLYRKYLEENVFENANSGQEGDDDELANKKRDPKSGSFSSLMNILKAVKTSTFSKSVEKSKQHLDKVCNKYGCGKMLYKSLMSFELFYGFLDNFILSS